MTRPTAFGNVPTERAAHLVGLTAADSRRHDEVVASLRTFTGYLIVDGFGAYQKLLPDPDPTPSPALPLTSTVAV